jgi:hypothetical protein
MIAVEHVIVKGLVTRSPITFPQNGTGADLVLSIDSNARVHKRPRTTNLFHSVHATSPLGAQIKRGRSEWITHTATGYRFRGAARATAPARSPARGSRPTVDGRGSTAFESCANSRWIDLRRPFYRLSPSYNKPANPYRITKARILPAT